MKYIENLLKHSVVILEDYESLNNYMLKYGSLGWSKILDKGAKLRAVYRSAIEKNDSIVLTFTELAKVYLYDIVDELRVKKFKSSINAFYSIQPLYAKAGRYDELYAYVDIKDAYYSIYSRWFRCSYRRFSYLSSVDDEGYELLKNLSTMSKRVKRAVYGIMRSNTLTNYRRVNEKIELYNIRVYHPLLHFDLVNFMLDFLQYIAHVCVKDYGAIYFNTDGAILLLSNVERYISFLNELGFQAKIKHMGQVEVKTIGAYKFIHFERGYEYKTLNFDRVHNHDFNNLTNEDLYKWFDSKLKKIKL